MYHFFLFLTGQCHSRFNPCSRWRESRAEEKCLHTVQFNSGARNFFSPLLTRSLTRNRLWNTWSHLAGFRWCILLPVSYVDFIFVSQGTRTLFSLATFWACGKYFLFTLRHDTCASVLSLFLPLHFSLTRETRCERRGEEWKMIVEGGRVMQLLFSRCTSDTDAGWDKNEWPWMRVLDWSIRQWVNQQSTRKLPVYPDDVLPLSLFLFPFLFVSLSLPSQSSIITCHRVHYSFHAAGTRFSTKKQNKILTARGGKKERERVQERRAKWCKWVSEPCDFIYVQRARERDKRTSVPIYTMDASIDFMFTNVLVLFTSHRWLDLTINSKLTATVCMQLHLLLS